jgi:hypothetical protein
MLRGFESHPLRWPPVFGVRIGGRDLTIESVVCILSRHLALRSSVGQRGGSVRVAGLATLAQSAEQAPCKRWVVGSNPTGGSRKAAHVAQTVEHALGKGVVKGSIPFVGSTVREDRPVVGKTGPERN